MNRKNAPEAKLPETFHLLDMGELAQYVNRHPQLIRKYYSDGVLPEPKHRIRHGKRTTRRFTIAEANEIKRIFDNMKWGTLAKVRERSDKRRERAGISTKRKARKR